MNETLLPLIVKAERRQVCVPALLFLRELNTSLPPHVATLAGISPRPLTFTELLLPPVIARTRGMAWHERSLPAFIFMHACVCVRACVLVFGKCDYECDAQRDASQASR